MPVGCAGCRRRAPWRGVERAGLGWADDLGLAEPLDCGLAEPLDCALAEPLDRGPVGLAFAVELRLAGPGLAAAFFAGAGPEACEAPSAGRAARFWLRRWGREWGRAPSTSDDR